MTRNLPSFLCEMLSSPPRTGDGVHSYLFRVARQLHAHLSAVEIVDLLETSVANCGRNVPRNEIVAAVQSSTVCAWRPGPVGLAEFRTASKWPAVNHGRREAVIRNVGGLADLWKLSPVGSIENAGCTETIIDCLFPGNPLLCCGWSKYEFDTRLREDWRGLLATLQFLVPSPMTAITGLTQDGRRSTHTLNNTGPRRFLVVEFDAGSIDGQAALLIHLAAYAPLVCAVHSGNKSLHGWFYVQGLTTWAACESRRIYQRHTPCEPRIPHGGNDRQRSVREHWITSRQG